MVLFLVQQIFAMRRQRELVDAMAARTLDRAP